jgi:hypothetical protein
VSDHWPRRFLDRYPELYKIKQKLIELKRKLTHDPTVILNWFERFQTLRTQFGVLNKDIWNFDKTGFRIDIRKS